MNLVGRDHAIHTIELRHCFVEVLKDNVYPIVRLNEGMHVRLG